MFIAACENGLSTEINVNSTYQKGGINHDKIIKDRTFV